MYRKNRKITLIAECYPQHGGDIDTLKKMFLQANMAGADFVKIQIYNYEKFSKKYGIQGKEYLELSVAELEELKSFCDIHQMKLCASVFDHDSFDKFKNAGLEHIKIASKISSSNDLDELKLIKTIYNFVSGCDSRTCYTSLDISKTSDDVLKFLYSIGPYGAYSYNFMYCVPSYPTLIDHVCLPKKFKEYNSIKYVKNKKPWYNGYSDHCVGLTPAKAAIVRGANVIEKHFTFSRGLQSTTEKAHYGSATFEEFLELRRFADEYSLMG